MAISFTAKLLSLNISLDLEVFFIIIHRKKLRMRKGLVHFDIKLFIGTFRRPKLCQIR